MLTHRRNRHWAAGPPRDKVSFSDLSHPGVVIVADDVQHNTELAELAGVFIHEIKNHLSTFGLHLQLLAEDFDQPQSPRERKALDRIVKLQSECRRLTEVANDFLRFAR